LLTMLLLLLLLLVMLLVARTALPVRPLVALLGRLRDSCWIFWHCFFWIRVTETVEWLFLLFSKVHGGSWTMSIGSIPRSYEGSYGCNQLKRRSGRKYRTPQPRRGACAAACWCK
jgi:hypothetical protein